MNKPRKINGICPKCERLLCECSNIKDKCIESLSFLEESGVLTYDQQENIEISIMNLEDFKDE